MKELNEYLEYLEYQRHYSPYTTDNYERDITEFLEYLEKENINYLHLEYSDIRLYLAYLKEEKHEKSTSISRKLSALRSYYRYLCNNNKIKTNLFNLISSPKKEQKLPRYFEYNELEELFAVPDLNTPLGQRDRLVLEILYATGIRVGELIKIRLKDINKSERTILVHGKGSKERIVNYGEYASEILIKYLNDGYKTLNKFHTDYLVLNNQGREITERGVRYILTSLIKKTSLHKNISPHMLRHSFATHLLNEGCDILSVKELLGHESISSTQIYTHITNDILKDIYLHSFPRANVKSSNN